MFRELFLYLTFSNILVCYCEIFPERGLKPQDCRPDEVYNTCGQACHPTCETPLYCTRECLVGCFCAKGLLRDQQGNCVKQGQCTRQLREDSELSLQNPQSHLPTQRALESAPSEPIEPERASYSADKCRADEEFKTCGSPCDDTCTTVVDKTPRPCTLHCAIGCFCKKPFVRDAEGNCIEASKCPGVERRISGTRFTTRYNSNTGLSPGTITFPYDSPNEGQAEDKTPYEPDNRSIASRGKPACHAGEMYTTCGTPCPDTCETITTQVNLNCPRYCVAGCHCLPGYVRDAVGFCVPKDTCGVTQQHQQPSTTIIEQAPIQLAAVYPLASFALRSLGSPARYVSSASECREDEDYNICGSDCIQTCDNRVGQCSYQCLSGCFCRAPKIRTADGHCVLPEQCPNRAEASIQQVSNQVVESSADVQQSEYTDNIRPERNTLNKQECRNDEEFKFCGTECSPTCSTIAHPKYFCGLKCVIGCFCKDNLVRAEDGSCIPAEHCPIGERKAVSSAPLLAADTGKTNYAPIDTTAQTSIPLDTTGKTNYSPSYTTGKTNYSPSYAPTSAALTSGKTSLRPSSPPPSVTPDGGKTNYAPITQAEYSEFTSNLPSATSAAPTYPTKTAEQPVQQAQASVRHQGKTNFRQKKVPFYAIKS